MPSKRILALAASSALALQAQAALAQQQCFSEAEVSSAFIYAMPGIIDGATTKCSGSLASSGFLARQGKTMSARYAKQQDSAWPRARSALLKFASNAGKGRAPNGTLDLLSQVPGETMRPVVDALIVQEAARRIQAKDCGKVEKLAAALDPLEPKEAGTLLGAMFAVVEPNHPPFCTARS